MSIQILVSKQNGDGGWPYVRGGSWTEPTVYAVMALLAAGEGGPARRGLAWIMRAQRSDGGWPPRPGVDQSTWVTALVAMLPAAELGEKAHARAIGWLLGLTGKESTTVYRIRQWMLGIRRPSDQQSPGWPWVPGTAAWVGPTSLAMMALEKEIRAHPSGAIAQRLDAGRRFLLSRMCFGGGWNHGSARPLGYESNAYPETTGMALAALRGVKSPEITQSIAVARRFLEAARSADALNWLQLGLEAHGALPPGFSRPAEIEPRTLSELSLAMIVSEPRNLLWVRRYAKTDFQA